MALENAVARVNEVSSSWGYKLYSLGGGLRYETESDPVGFNLKVTLTLLTMSTMNAVEPVGYSPGYNPSVVTKESFSGLGTLRFTAATVARGGKELFNFGSTAAKHMTEPGRAVLIQILQQAIKGSKGVLDPKGSRALMHSTEMWRNGKAYQLDVLYDKVNNSIWHFQYSPIKL